MKLPHYFTYTLFSLLLSSSGKAQAQEKTLRFVLSSNLLSWVTLTPNLGAEVYIRKRGSPPFVVGERSSSLNRSLTMV